MDAEQERLGALYAQMSDEQIVRLAGDPDALTDAARAATGAEVVRRGLNVRLRAEAGEQGAAEMAMGPRASSQEVAAALDRGERESGFAAGIPGFFPSSAAAVEQALEPGGADAHGFVSLLTLFDGHELARACELLDAAGVEFGIQEIAGDALAGSPSHQEIWVAAGDLERSQQLLRERLGYFPLAEIAARQSAEDALLTDSDDDRESPATVGQFETSAEAERMRALLAGEGITAKVQTDAEEPGSFDVTVRGRDQERALSVAERTLGVR